MQCVHMQMGLQWVHCYSDNTCEEPAGNEDKYWLGSWEGLDGMDHWICGSNVEKIRSCRIDCCGIGPLGNDNPACK